MKHVCKYLCAFASVVGISTTNATHAQNGTTPAIQFDASVQMKPYRDPWKPARERWRDIADNPLTAFINGSQGFNYRDVWVTLSYASAPPTPYFIGRISAKGLKPNFAYQLKLVGKPRKGTQGWGKESDAVGNERLGYAGRWWCGHPIHASGTNFDDNHYLNEYKNALPGMEHNMYGYIYLGEFVTDANGNAQTDFFGDHAYHISWASWQGGAKDVLAGRFPVRSNSTSNGAQYGYGQLPISSSVTLHYENEPGRTQPVTLPPGTYNARFLITEESFHNNVNNSPEGGYWKTVLASEDFVYDADGNIIGHDTDPSNDVVFTINARPETTQMKASVSLNIKEPETGKYEATAQVKVVDIQGRPIRDANVIGYWTGLHRTTGISAQTNSTGIGGDSSRSDGVAQFTTPVIKARHGEFRFIVTDIVKTGRIWNRLQPLGAQARISGR